MIKKPRSKSCFPLKKEKKEPVAFNSTIAAAFMRQERGKTCAICNTKLSIAAYREHVDNCKVDENDVEISIVASYSREEAILLRAGPEIVLHDEPPDEPSPARPATPLKKRKNPVDCEKLEKIDDQLNEKPAERPATPLKKRKNHVEPEEAEKEDETPVDEPKKIKLSPKTPRRRSARIQMSSERIVKKKVDPVEVKPIIREDKTCEEVNEEEYVKTENPTVSDILTSIKKFEKEHQNLQGDENNDTPYYVKFTIRIIKKIFSTEKSDGSKYDEKFWSKEDLQIILRFTEILSIDAKCAFLRLLLRKPGWYPLSKLDQKYSEVNCMKNAIYELVKWQLIDDEASMQTIEEALKIADLQNLKVIAKKLQLDTNKNKIELTRSIKNFSESQRTIFGLATNVKNTLLKSLKKELGVCVKIKKDVLNLFRAMFTIYCPTTTNSAVVIENPRTNVYQEMLFMMLQIENRAIKYPSPNPCPNITSFFKNRDQLLCYINAKNMETRIIIEMSQTPPNYDGAFDLALKAKDLIDEMPQLEKRATNELPIFERKFSKLWVLTRCCGHGATILEKKKKYGMAAEWQKYLLKSEGLINVCVDMRGVWWDRLLLNLETHLKQKEECCKLILEALEDESIMEKEYLMIQDRATRVLKYKNGIFEPKILIEEAEKVTKSARIIGKDLGDGRQNRFVYTNEKDEDVECSVEEIVRQRYLEEEGFKKGTHDEGKSWHTILGILFYDVIFETQKYGDTWLSEIQDCPIDMNNCLYYRRKLDFEKRFEWLEKVEEEEIFREIDKKWKEKKGETNRECYWNHFEVDDIKEIIQCIERPALIKILKRLTQNYRNCRSGFPDLILWNVETRKLAVVEVKGPGDRLSTKQRLWLHHFQQCGIQAQVCHVTGRKDKHLI